jgi:DNA polymerase-3 subunit beta
MACEEHHLSHRVTVPAKKFIDIIRSLDEGASAHLKTIESILTIKAHRSQFKLAILPADDYPKNTHEQIDLEITLAKTELLQLLHSTFFAMSQQDVRFYLNGLLLEFNGDFLTAVSTDGHRMAVYKTNSPVFLEHQRYLLPRKSVQEMMKLLNTVDDETIKLSAGKNFLRLSTQDFQLTTKLIETRFPPYMKAIPVDNDKFVLVDKELLKRALSRIIILANEKSRAVLMQIEANELILIANNQEQEEAMESLEATVDGQALTIGINACYLLDVLPVLVGDVVRISLSTINNSILIESIQAENYKYVIMPMKL